MGNLLKFYENEARFKNKINMNVIKFIDDVVNFPDRDGTVNDGVKAITAFEAGKINEKN